ncbi:MAG: hypothetical protein WC850_03510 [Candidatus Gracilibacteria bacterium]
MKKIILFFILISLKVNTVLGADPYIECEGLPGCNVASSTNALSFVKTLVAELIKYVAVVAVLALIAAGFMYIFSGGEEEKVKKARKWIIWSIVAVFISISGYFLINLINEAQINI